MMYYINFYRRHPVSKTTQIVARIRRQWTTYDKICVDYQGKIQIFPIYFLARNLL